MELTNRSSSKHTGQALTEAIGLETLGGVFTPVLEAGCTLPCRSTQHFSTAVDDQTEIMLSLYRGVSERSSENDHLGRFVIRDIALCPKVSRRLMSSSRRA
ncbi:MAG: Hsp70 family protein [Xanthomonadales bacterium]|nr:Hsp70 family protein [Xanthomonadales bacterium]